MEVTPRHVEIHISAIILAVYHFLDDIANALNEHCVTQEIHMVGHRQEYISFWDYETKEIYYIGLAVDFEDRFKQHNGFLPIDTSSCKLEKIEEYFRTKEKLGYSIYVHLHYHSQ